MRFKTKTFPYGSTRAGTVLFTKTIPWKGGRLTIQAVHDDQGEGHVMFGDSPDPSAQEGDQGTLTFTAGGPTGGYWRFKKNI